ncbi:MAG: TolC family protein, partial [Akkermansiaceae bacterium]|nr:TolC family protein [Akkermansiaceae bacterium]
LDYWGAGLDVSWEIDVFGGRRREARAATARAQAAREALHATRLAIVSETVEAYCTLAGLQAQLARIQHQVRGQEAQLA